MPGTENPLDRPAITWRLFHPRRTCIVPTFVVGEGFGSAAMPSASITRLAPDPLFK